MEKLHSWKTTRFFSLFIVISFILLNDTKLNSAEFQNISITGIDDRSASKAFIDAENWMRYSNIGRVVCPIPGSSDLWVSSGFVASALNTVVTTSHAFYMPEEKSGHRVNFIYLKPETCSFQMFSYNGYELDKIPIQFALSRWDNVHMQGDRANDVSAVRLARRPKQSFRTPEIWDGSDLDGATIVLCAHHNDLPNSNIPRLGWGKLQIIKEATGKAPRRFLTDIDTSSGASGGMYINPRNGSVIGIHGGSEGNGMNYGILFDWELIAALERAAADPV